ncbi:unnamed protein product, partial [Oikopleura dioica]
SCAISTPSSALTVAAAETIENVGMLVLTLISVSTFINCYSISYFVNYTMGLEKKKPRRAGYIDTILATPPICCLCALLILLSPRIALFMNFILNFTLGLSITMLFSLILDYFDSFDHFLNEAKKTKWSVRIWLWRFFFCIPRITPTRQWFSQLYWGSLQVVFIRCAFIIANACFVAEGIWTRDAKSPHPRFTPPMGGIHPTPPPPIFFLKNFQKCDEWVMAGDFASLIWTVDTGSISSLFCGLVSTGLAVFCLAVLSDNLATCMGDFHIKLKFICFRLTLISVNIQPIILSFFDYTCVYPHTAAGRSTILHNILVVIEMFLKRFLNNSDISVSLLYRYVFMYKYVEDKNFDIGRELVLPKDLKELAEGFVSRLTHVVMHNDSGEEESENEPKRRSRWISDGDTESMFSVNLK